MDTLYLVLIILVVVGGLAFGTWLYFKRPKTLKKYWGWLAGVIGSLVGALAFLWIRDLLRRDRLSQPNADPVIAEKEQKLREDLGVSRQEMEEELQKVRVEEEEVHHRLEEIDEIDDELERLQALADLWNKRRGR